MTQFEWMIIGVSCLIVGGGLAVWLTNIAVGVGRIIQELHDIKESLQGHVSWIKEHDKQLDDHERRITKLELEV